MDYHGFSLERDTISVLTFTDPGVNVFSTAVLKDLERALNTLDGDRGLRVLVITGRGAVFMAGADIKEMRGFGPEEAMEFSRLFHRAFSLVEDLGAVVIAGVNGFALGGGCELTLVADMVIAADNAVFGQPEIDLGLIPGGGGTVRLARRVGELRAMELILTGRKIPAMEALEIGLVNRVVPRERLQEDVMKLAREIASKPAQCTVAAKSLVRSGRLEDEARAFGKMFSYDEQRELMEGFLKKKR